MPGPMLQEVVPNSGIPSTLAEASRKMRNGKWELTGVFAIAQPPTGGDLVAMAQSPICVACGATMQESDWVSRDVPPPRPRDPNHKCLHSCCPQQKLEIYEDMFLTQIASITCTKCREKIRSEIIPIAPPGAAKNPAHKPPPQVPELPNEQPPIAHSANSSANSDGGKIDQSQAAGDTCRCQCCVRLRNLQMRLEEICGARASLAAAEPPRERVNWFGNPPDLGFPQPMLPPTATATISCSCGRPHPYQERILSDPNFNPATFDFSLLPPCGMCHVPLGVHANRVEEGGNSAGKNGSSSSGATHPAPNPNYGRPSASSANGGPRPPATAGVSAGASLTAGGTFGGYGGAQGGPAGNGCVPRPVAVTDQLAAGTSAQGPSTRAPTRLPPTGASSGASVAPPPAQGGRSAPSQSAATPMAGYDVNQTPPPPQNSTAPPPAPAQRRCQCNECLGKANGDDESYDEEEYSDEVSEDEEGDECYGPKGQPCANHNHTHGCPQTPAPRPNHDPNITRNKLRQLLKMKKEQKEKEMMMQGQGDSTRRGSGERLQAGGSNGGKAGFQVAAKVDDLLMYIEGQKSKPLANPQAEADAKSSKAAKRARKREQQAKKGPDSPLDTPSSQHEFPPSTPADAGAGAGRAQPKGGFLAQAQAEIVNGLEGMQKQVKGSKKPAPAAVEISTKTKSGAPQKKISEEQPEKMKSPSVMNGTKSGKGSSAKGELMSVSSLKGGSNVKISTSFEDIFAPRESLDGVDEHDREVEEFKRFVSAAIPADRKERVKVNVNLNMLGIKAKHRPRV